MSGEQSWSPRTETCVSPTPASLVDDAVAWFIGRLTRAQAEGRDPHVALTGGTIAEEFHRELALRLSDSGVDTSRVHWWFGDERFVPPDSPDLNAGQALAALAPAALPSELVHTVDTTLPSAAAAADDYASRLSAARPATGPAFDVVFLGMGPDGHVASLFPSHASLDAQGLCVAELDSPKPPAQRVSLTLGALNDAAAVAFLVSGAGKAEAYAAARAPGSVSECPARGVRGLGETVWFVDSAAASLATG